MLPAPGCHGTGEGPLRFRGSHANPLPLPRAPNSGLAPSSAGPGNTAITTRGSSLGSELRAAPPAQPGKCAGHGWYTIQRISGGATLTGGVIAPFPMSCDDIGPRPRQRNPRSFEVVGAGSRRCR